MSQNIVTPSNGSWEQSHTPTGLLVSDLMVHHKTSVPDAHIVPAINGHIQVIEAQDVGEDAEDATSMTATVVVQEGDARSRAEHLRHLMAEIQRELAESDSMTNVND
ncbi:hypothetical protein DXG01_014723 [Tephrocybe rancida]|nr:hypothetical protein DXG01_014723 [Tephrocybe rancida]